jgi:hypothetical protein
MHHDALPMGLTYKVKKKITYYCKKLIKTFKKSFIQCQAHS